MFEARDRRPLPPCNRLLVGVTLFFAGNLALFYLSSQWPAVRQSLGLVFYVWLGVFSMMTVAQFWALRVVQMTPPGSSTSVVVGEGMPLGEPGATHGLQLVVDDLDAARAALSGRMPGAGRTSWSSRKPTCFV